LAIENGLENFLIIINTTGNLDSKNGEAVMALLAELHNQGATICLVAHDPVTPVSRTARFSFLTVALPRSRIVVKAVFTV